MSEQNKNHQDQETSERPAPNSEQLKAFRSAYSMLTKKASEGDRVMVDADLGTELYWTERMFVSNGRPAKMFTVNATGGSALLVSDADRTDAKMWSWVYGHDESYVHTSGKLGSFSVGTSEDGTEQDLYEFYPDGNIEKLHFHMDTNNVGDSETLHVGWLTPQETEELAVTLENIEVQG